MKHRVAVIGNGNFGTAISKLLAENVLTHPDFDQKVYLWTFEEQIEGKNLSAIINETHENVKYLKGTKLPKNVFAEPDILKCVDACDVLVFVVPHQFVKNIVQKIKEKVALNSCCTDIKCKNCHEDPKINIGSSKGSKKEDKNENEPVNEQVDVKKEKCGHSCLNLKPSNSEKNNNTKHLNDKRKYHAVSLIKGLFFDNNEIQRVSEYISNELNLNCGVLMGANIATQIANDAVSEATLSCKNEKSQKILMKLFNSFKFRVSVTRSLECIELCGTLKNVVAIAYGIAKGLEYPDNTSVAILRNGLKEIIKFCEMFCSYMDPMVFFESAGVADLIVSCLNGRNFKCGVCVANKMCIKDVEKNMDGQKLQGTSTSKGGLRVFKK
ncbi:hypothetical protein EDEG_02000 [Edhazardia aedis USNM 41457]|uniref:Glycerol-3-phosphate dehydrogenase [NAD(+)] n=1 Tax=Edhazardia aedis (strain USNM 41457) TaxID=1003232 RepID=J8ZVM5_EDHAE|nr:hypothetical protein EDEG_02000 [Edhazardia aedis USNM 41457]|eukprot:EJW03708.1 hypothetical protein EDEG_02000 [Edhazardia aedis USNM 41457]